MRWEPRKKRCSVFAAYEGCGTNSGGISKAKTKIRRALSKQKAPVAISTGGEVPCRWFLSALEKVVKLKPEGVFFEDLPPLDGDPDLSDALRTFPLRNPAKAAFPDVTVRVLAHAKAPFGGLAKVLAFLERVGVLKIDVGDSPRRRIEARLPAPGTGGNERSPEAAIAQALGWLKAHQGEDGTWSCREFKKRCGKGSCGGPGSSRDYDIGLTGMALLAFLGAGHTQGRGDHREVVGKGLKALLETQTSEGCFGEQHEDGHWIYNQAFCTFALAEALEGGGKVPGLKPAAQKAVDFLVTCQNPGSGWRYGVRPGKSDTSCTALSAEALMAARRNGLNVPASAFQGAVAWIDQVTDKKYHVTGYTSAGDSGARLPEAAGKFRPAQTMTAAGLVCRVLLQGLDPSSSPVVKGAADLVVQDLPKWSSESIDMYYWYWGTMAMKKAGGKYWEAWRGPLEKAILPNQNLEGCEAGSWDPVGAWGTAGGRVFATAVNALTLEIPFGYLRIHRGK
jgi:hypothetical protein